MKIISAAGLGRGVGNQQTWRFLVIKNRAIMEEMRQALLETVEEMVNWPEWKAYEGQLQRIRKRGTKSPDAPVVIAVLIESYDIPVYRYVLPARGFMFERIHRLQADLGIESVAAAIQNLHSVGTCLAWAMVLAG